MQQLAIPEQRMEQHCEPEFSPLETLANARFGPLHEAEYRLLRAVQRGESADCGPAGKGLNAPENDPKNPSKWEEDRAIRAVLLRWLCIDATVRPLIDPFGIKILSARLDGRLQLSYATLPFPLTMIGCQLPDGLDLRGAELPALILTHNRIGPCESAILADGARVKGPVLLHGTQGEGEVRLHSARIGSTLECDGACFKNSDKVAFEYDNVKAGSVFLRSVFDPPLYGEVRLVSEFRAYGEVRLVGAEIHGNLECTDALFLNGGAVALEAQSTKIDGCVFLKRLRTDAGIRLVGAEIGADLDMKGADLSLYPVVPHKGGAWSYGALDATGATIKGFLRIKEVKTRPQTRISLWAANCNVLSDDDTSWPDRGNLSLDGFVYRHLDPPGNARARLDWLRRQLPSTRPEPTRSERARPRLYSRAEGFSPQPYRQLAQVLRAQGYEAEARDILIGMVQDRRKYARLGWWPWVWTLVLWHVIRNGYKPLRAVRWLLALWLASGFVFGTGNKKEDQRTSTPSRRSLQITEPCLIGIHPFRRRFMQLTSLCR
jgi:hypothetical protein